MTKNWTTQKARNLDAGILGDVRNDKKNSSLKLSDTDHSKRLGDKIR